MALVRICPNCNRQNLADQFVCQCGTSLIQTPTILFPDSEAKTGHPVAPTQSQEANKRILCRKCLNPDCRFDGNPVDAESCLRCGKLFDTASAPSGLPVAGTTRESVLGIRFPFGEVRVNGVLKIGRDPNYSSIAHQIKNLDKVSKRHAEIRIWGNKITVVDNESTNGVRVNGEMIPPKEPFSLCVGDEVSFSSQLQARVISGDS